MNHKSFTPILSKEIGRRKMKRITVLFLTMGIGAIILLTSGIAFAHGNIDQSNPGGIGGSQILAHMPVGQEFTPSQDILVAVDVKLGLATDEGSDTITVNIRKGTITSPILATASQVVAPCPDTPPFSCGLVHFDFPAPLLVNPGDTYVLELQATKQTHAWTRDDGGYPAGVAILQGVVEPAFDFSFQTYAEPTFPRTSVLDDFNRPDGGLGPNWLGAREGYKIANQQVKIDDGGLAFWKPDTFGADQEAFVTLAKVDREGRQHGLLLKAQGPKRQHGVILVFYRAREHKPGRVGIQTFVPGQGWKTLATFEATLHDGDQLGGRALVNGTVQVYVNGELIGEANAGSFFAGKGGRIGLWFKEAEDARLDDFGGGTIMP